MGGLESAVGYRMASGVTCRRILRGRSEVDGGEQRSGLRASRGSFVAVRSFPGARTLPRSLHGADNGGDIQRKSAEARIVPQSILRTPKRNEKQNKRQWKH